MRAMLIAIGLALALAAPSVAQAEPRLALLIGNESYPASVGQLSQSHSDVARMAEALEDVGFDVTSVLDADEDALELAIATFANSLSEAGDGATGFFYYAGHGASAVVRGERRNYLIPANEEITDATMLSVRGVEEQLVIDTLGEAGAAALFIVIDACRNDLLPAFSRSAGERGFGVTAARPGLFIAHSTYPGQTAPDDGAFSQALAAQITQGHMRAGRAFELAYRNVAQRRDGYALPTVAASLRDDFCFVSCPEAAGAAVGAAVEAAYLRAVESDDRAVLQAFLIMFPDSTRAEEARLLLAEHDAEGETAPALDTAEAVIATLDAMDTLDPSFRTWDALDEIVAAHGFEALLAAVDQGHPGAASIAGRAFDDGLYTEQDEARAVELFRLACDSGDLVGCVNLGGAYQTGGGVAQDDAEAVSLFRQACDGGRMTGCRNLGFMYRDGRGVAQDNVEAVRLYRQACDGGEASGCGNLGYMYANGRGVAQDDAEAVRLYRQACDGGNALDCGNLGVMYANGRGVAQDDVEAVRLYRQACDGDGASRCSNLGYMYANGRGVAQDDAEAVRLYRQACDGGNALDCGNLGVMYENGRGVAQDYSQALLFYLRACEGDNAIACGNVGNMYYFARGVERDYFEANRLYELACAGENGLSCGNLGIMRRDGQGGPRDLDAYATFTERACELGELVRCAELAQDYDSRGRLPRDYARAAQLFTQACEGGRMVSCNDAAWVMSTAPDDSARNGPEAVRLALIAVESAPNNYGWRDTLAAAYAENGQFEDAIREQEAAIAGGGTSSGYHQALARYRAGQPTRAD